MFRKKKSETSENDIYKLEENAIISPIKKPVRIIFFTDPVSSAAWGIEPQMRRMMLEYGHLFQIEYRMGGLFSSWEDLIAVGIEQPIELSFHWKEAANFYGMPIDGGIWAEDPLQSSYSPSIAFKAAQLQSHKKSLAFLRRIQEMIFIEKKNITKWEFIKQAAEEVGLDTDKLLQDFENDALPLFEYDLEYRGRFNAKSLPILVFTNTLNEASVIYGYRSYQAFENSILQLVPAAIKRPFDSSWENLFRLYPTLSNKEISVISDLSNQEVENLMTSLYEQKKIDKIECESGILWKRIPSSRESTDE